MNIRLKHFTVLIIGISLMLGFYAEVDACTRMFWNIMTDLKVVARNEVRLKVIHDHYEYATESKSPWPIYRATLRSLRSRTVRSQFFTARNTES